MKKTVMVIGILGGLMMGVSGANADVHVRGNFRANGTYVEPHFRSNPDGNLNNNWSTSGNYNPHTGSLGTRNPYGSSDMLSRPGNSDNLLGQSWGSSRLY